MFVNIPRRYSTALLNSLSAGVVPRIGLEYIAVGRKKEINAVLTDLDNIAEGGGAFRFIIGRYGSGKSFLLQLARSNALQRNYLVADVDMSPERRLTGTDRQGLKLYRALISRLATRARPDGNAAESLLQRWIASLQEGSTDESYVEEKIRKVSEQLREYLYGTDLARVLLCYWHGYRDGNDVLCQNALRWLRGEYERKIEARTDLGVDRIIEDSTWYEFVKLLAILSRQIGYKGMLIFIDEEVNLFKITNRVSRENNYEKLLAMFNDIMQGNVQSLGIYFGSTVQAVEDNRRGLYSYEALRSRLQPGRLVRQGLTDFSGPLIRLEPLTHEDIFVLLENLMQVFCSHYQLDPPLDASQLQHFMEATAGRIGTDSLLTPREVTRDFISLLNLIRENPNETFESLMQSESFTASFSADAPDADNNEFAAFDL